MAQLAAIAPFVQLAAVAYGAASQYTAGKTAAAQSKLQAVHLEQDANAAEVEAQGVARNERRRARLLRSRALAVAGASGAGVGDPTVVDIMDDIGKEGELRALNALSEGRYLADSLRNGAQSRRNMGRASQTAGTIDAVSTGVQGGLSFFEKYG